MYVCVCVCGAEKFSDRLRKTDQETYIFTHPFYPRIVSNIYLNMYACIAW